MADRRGTHDKHVTVTDTVTVGAHSDIATVTVTGSDCTGDNRSKFILREDKQLLSCIETLRFIVRKQNRRFLRFVMYRQIFSCEFNVHVFKPKKARISKNLLKKEKGKRNRNSVP